MTFKILKYYIMKIRNYCSLRRILDSFHNSSGCNNFVCPVKNMDNDISNIKKHPSPFCDALHDAMNLIFFSDFVFYRIGQALKHSVTCTCANDKVICKIDLFSYIHQRYFFRFMIFQNFDNFSSKCYGFQFILLFIL